MFNRKAWMKRYKQYYYKKHRADLIAYSALWNKLRPEVRAVIGARYRCDNPKARAYKDYGGRGIKCFLTVEQLPDDIGPRPNKNLSLDRIDNDGNYEVGNIRWATHKQQQNNRRVSRCVA